MSVSNHSHGWPSGAPLSAAPLRYVLFSEHAALKDYVIVNIDWFINGVGLVIQDPTVHLGHLKKRGRSAGSLLSGMKSLWREGVVTHKVLDELWKDVDAKGGKDGKEASNQSKDWETSNAHANALKNLMLKFGLMSHMKASSSSLGAKQSSDDVIFVVPAMLPEKPAPESLPAAQWCTLTFAACDEEGRTLPLLPETLWGQMLTQCISFNDMLSGEGPKPRVAREWARLSFGGQQFDMRRDNESNSIRIGLTHAFPTPIAEQLRELAMSVIDASRAWIKQDMVVSLSVRVKGCELDLRELQTKIAHDQGIYHPETDQEVLDRGDRTGGGLANRLGTCHLAPSRSLLTRSPTSLGCVTPALVRGPDAMDPRA